MCSVPLPGLDRYLADPSRARLLCSRPLDLEHGSKSSRTPVASSLAIVVLVIAAYVLFKVVIGFVAAVAWIVIAVVAVVAVVWAIRVL